MRRAGLLSLAMVVMLPASCGGHPDVFPPMLKGDYSVGGFARVGQIMDFGVSLGIPTADVKLSIFRLIDRPAALRVVYSGALWIRKFGTGIGVDRGDFRTLYPQRFELHPVTEVTLAAQQEVEWQLIFAVRALRRGTFKIPDEEIVYRTRDGKAVHVFHQEFEVRVLGCTSGADYRLPLCAEPLEPTPGASH